MAIHPDPRRETSDGSQSVIDALDEIAELPEAHAINGHRMRVEAPYVSRRVESDADFEEYANEFIESVKDIPTYRPVVGCVVPAYNEAESIGSVIEGLLAQTRVPDSIHIVVNNSTDDTVKIASTYAGPHEVVVDGEEQFCEVFVHDIGKNPEKKVGALNYGFFLVEGSDYLLGVDGDTVPAPDATKQLVDEISTDLRIGGISAIYSIDDRPIKGFIPKFLIAGQKAQFAAFNMQNLLRGRNMAVLGGQFSIFSVRALREVMQHNHQNAPWVKDSEIEDSLLSLQIKSAGYLTKISPTARADVGGMTTMRGLDGQQVKWNYGAIELMWPGQRGDTKGQPFHPNLRLRWFEHLSMVMNIFTRLLFIALLTASLSISAFVFVAWWLFVPLTATLLNLRVAMSMTNRSSRDMAFALFFFPAEIYMWIRMGHFVRAWAKFFSRKKVDNWAAQAKAERGAGYGYLIPWIIVLASFIAAGFLWFQLTPVVQSTILWLGWPVLGVITIIQSLNMLFKLIRRQHGFKV